MTTETQQRGAILAERLGIKIIGTEGHDLVAPCVSCNSSDGLRIDQSTGKAWCFVCESKWSPYNLALAYLDKPQAIDLMVKIGVFEPRNSNGRPAEDIIETVARLKRIPVESLIAYGAHPDMRGKAPVCRIPAYNSQGESHSYFYLPRDGGKGWFKQGAGSSGIFFPGRLPQPGETWLIVEGPKDPAALHGLGFLAAGLNTSKMAVKYARLFRDVDVVVVGDRDRAGEDGAETTAARLHGVARSVRIATLPAEFKEKGGADVRDVLALKDGEALLRQALKDAKEWKPSVNPAGEPDERGEPTSNAKTPETSDDDGNVASDASDAKKQKPSQATLLVGLTEGVDLFHHDGEAFATVQVADHRETHLLKSKPFRRWLSRRFYLAFEKAPGSQAMQDALGVLEGKALFDGAEHHVYTRLAEHDGAYFLDLGDEKWQTAVITAKGWKIQSDVPVRFRRPRGLQALPIPDRDGAESAIAELRGFVNVRDDSDWVLMCSWLVAALRPSGPYPVLCLHGEQGSAKSTTAKVLRLLVDPNKAALRAEPRDPHDLVITARNSWVISLDNISHLPPWLSDALCRLATGGGFGTRELYSDQEEVIFDSQRPLLLNGIEELATRGDLLDRAIIINLPEIHEEDRRDEAEFKAEFKEAQPRILAALLTAIASAMKRLPSIGLDRKPRMADFALWATAAEQSLGFGNGAFMDAYTRNRQSANDLALEASPIVPAIHSLIEDRLSFSGTATDLLHELQQRTDEKIQKQQSFPKAPHAMSGHLKRIAPNLRGAGFTVEFAKGERPRLIRISTQKSVPSDRSDISGISSDFSVASDASAVASVASTVASDPQKRCTVASDASDASLRTHSKSNEEPITDGRE